MDAPFEPFHPLRFWGYQLWSGPASDLEYAIQLVGGIFILWRLYKNFKTHVWPHLQCHNADCTKLGIHPVKGTPYRTCWHHHPILGQHEHHAVPLHIIHAAHREANNAH